MLTDVIWLFIGGGLIYVGAEWLVWGGSRLARKFNVSPIVIGLSVVAFGTSLPEFTVSLYSAINDVQDIAIGNILGSNIANVALILASSALIFPVAARYSEVREDVLLVIGITVFFVLLAVDGTLSRVDGILMSAGMVYYLWRLVTSKRVETEIADGTHNLSRYAGALVAGLVLLVWGTSRFTESAIDIARMFGIPELVIGATIVAVGTSLPELATSMVAAFRKQSGIVLGNILGSNVFNLLAVLGIISVYKPMEVPRQAIIVQIPLMLLLTVILLPALKYQGGIKRALAISLLLVYVAFTLFVYMNGNPA